MVRLTRRFLNVGIALAIVLALVASAWGTLPAAALQSQDGADFTATIDDTAGGASQAMVQAVAPAPARVGDVVTFTIRGNGAQGITAFQFALQYDEQGLDFQSIEVAPEWKAAGYSVIMMGPVRQGGVVHFGAVVCPVGDCVGNDYTQAKQDLSALPAGEVLANVNFTVQTPGTHAFTVTESKMANAAGLPVNAAQAAATQAPDLRIFDLTENGRINDSDAYVVISAWGSMLERGVCISPATQPYDLDGSGCVDAADAQMILANWGADVRPQALAAEAPAAIERLFTVNDNGSGADAAPGDGVCATAGDVCTLRAAIQESNMWPGRDTIEFNIRGGGGACPASVTISSATNMIVDDANELGTVIDGYSQCDASPNTQQINGNAVIKINLQGTLTEDVYGIYLTSPINVVRGLAIYNFDQQIAVRGASADENLIEGNFLGTNSAQTHQTDFAVVESNGIDFRVGADHNTLGGTSPAKRNLISGNDQDGVNIQGPDVHDNVVTNNYIGLKQNGVTRLRNSSDGLDLAGGTYNNRIGGLNPNERNVIGGNFGDGVEISHDETHNNEVVGNWIGLNATGTAITPNEDRGVTLEDINLANNGLKNIVRRNIIAGNYGHGVRFYTATYNEVSNNFIGVYPPGLGANTVVPAPSTGLLNTLVNAPNGALPAAGTGLSGILAEGGSQHNLIKDNIIANHPEYGVAINPNHGYLGIGSCQTYFNTISENWIYNNGLHGIRLLTNTCSSQQFIGNQGIPAPVITNANTAQVTGTTCANCRVEVFLADKTNVNNPGDNFGEGKVFVGTAMANAAGAFTVNINGVAINQLVTATATSASGNTSEFARNTVVGIAPGDIDDFPFELMLPLVLR